MDNMHKEKPKETPQVEVKWSGNVMHLENVFIGGRWVEEGKSPVGFYGGEINIGEMGISLMNLLRGVIQITSEECGLTPDKCEDFIVSCVAEAIRREEADRRDEVLEGLVRRFMDNQN